MMMSDDDADDDDNDGDDALSLSLFLPLSLFFFYQAFPSASTAKDRAIIDRAITDRLH